MQRAYREAQVQHPKNWGRTYVQTSITELKSARSTINSSLLSYGHRGFVFHTRLRLHEKHFVDKRCLSRTPLEVRDGGAASLKWWNPKMHVKMDLGPLALTTGVWLQLSLSSNELYLQEALITSCTLMCVLCTRIQFQVGEALQELASN